MKKILILFVMAACFPAFSQKEPITTTNNHEIGVDATPLLQLFLFNSGYPNISPYFLMYRYQWNDWAIRAAIGGNTRVGESVTNDTVKRETDVKMLEFRIGVERQIDFGRRWQFFYGLDLRVRKSRSVSEIQYSAIGGKQTYDDNLDQYGLGPLLGFRFKINERISITTETNFLIYYYKGHDKRIYEPDEIYNQETEMKGWQTDFSPPASVFFTFNF